MKITDDFFKIDNTLKPEKGRVLISEPLLNDYFFKRSVVLLTEHNDEGSMGFVINNPIDTKLIDLLPDFPDFDANISIGGPVSTDMIQFIHTLGKKVSGCIEIKPDLFWGGDFNDLKNLLSKGEVEKNQILFFLGYSGWSPNQLNEEIEQNSWLISRLSTEDIMAYKENIWRSSLSGLGEKKRPGLTFPTTRILISVCKSFSLNSFFCLIPVATRVLTHGFVLNIQPYSKNITCDILLLFVTIAQR